MSEAMVQLELRKESIDVGRVGLFSGLYAMVVDLDVKAIEDATSKYALAQGLIDNLSNTEGGLTCREAIVYLDLCDSQGNLIVSGDWRQPVSTDTSTSFGGSHTLSSPSYYNSNTGSKLSVNSQTGAVEIYSTNAAIARNDRKVYVAWGVRQVGSGPARDHAVLAINAWIWKRSDVKTIDQWQMQQLETVDGQAVYGQTPILYKRNDDMAVWVIPNARVSIGTWKFDQLQVLMKVVESLGTTVMG
jgi:hypothetical protein